MGLFKDCGCGCGGAKSRDKFLLALLLSLIFFLVASPETFQVTRSLAGVWVSTPTGCPLLGGLVLHSIVFLLLSWWLMSFKPENYVNPASAHNKPAKQ